jgi:hypothetical protein
MPPFGLALAALGLPPAVTSDAVFGKDKGRMARGFQRAFMMNDRNRQRNMALCFNIVCTLSFEQIRH